MKRHKHNLNHYRVMSGRMGELIPVSCMEVLPGDTIRMQSTCLLRLSPMNAPVMHPLHVRMHSFFVPNRIIWPEWEDFIPDMNTALSVPTVGIDVAEGTLLDYLGIPPDDYSSKPVNALPLMACNEVWNEFFRDQDIDAERDSLDNSLPRVRWEKDYFTTARLEAQSGATETVDIEFDNPLPVQTNADLGTAQGNGVINDGANTNVRVFGINDSTLQVPAQTAAGSMDINEWRRAMAWQRLAEHRNKYGSRFTDYLNFLGVRSSDARLQRPEYLGGGSTTVNISEVLSTADTVGVDQGAPVGALSGHGIAGHRTRPFRRFIEEHGHIITFASVRPKTIYSQGIHRNWWRAKPADYWQKEMEIMGDQPVLVGEIYGLSDTPKTSLDTSIAIVTTDSIPLMSLEK
ncbi:putative major capsid protein [Eel River basin pequenovirus]|nr:putative major capsid protein [Eel River basin pequenovirus]